MRKKMRFLTPDDVIRVSIGIQARSTSKRFPRKEFEIIGNKMLIQHVMDSCESAARYINRHGVKTRVNVSTHLLVPEGDDLLELFNFKCITGPEDDVLARYVKLKIKTDADYVVRVTGDCPLIPHFVISKAIAVATQNEYDYCSNVQENARTSADGFDVEVISKRALEWADQNAKSATHREHVTLVLRSEDIPNSFKIGHMIGHIMNSQKLSVDTKEDLARVREEYEKIKNMINYVQTLPGKNSVHRY